LPKRFKVVRQQEGFAAGPRGSERRLGSGVSAPDHDYIELSSGLHRFQRNTEQEKCRILRPNGWGKQEFHGEMAPGIPFKALFHVEHPQ
jgi:hypothetical protein